MRTFVALVVLSFACGISSSAAAAELGDEPAWNAAGPRRLPATNPREPPALEPPDPVAPSTELPATTALTSADDLPLLPRTWRTATGATFQLRGRIDTDVISTSQSALDTATFGDLRSVIGLRRARIGGQGEFGDSGRYIGEIDLASGSVVIRDLYFGVGELQTTGQRRAGHFREPFSLEGGTSANSFAFVERSQANRLDPARNWGVGLYRTNADESATFDCGVFQAGTDANDFQGGDGSTVGFTARLTTAPINEAGGRRLLHLGTALSARLPESGVIIINQRPSSSLLDLGDSTTSPFIPRIVIPADFQQLINLQFAATRGPFWLQSEWYGTYVDQRGGGPIFYNGSYISCGYFATGEHRGYLATQGVLGPVEVSRPLIQCLSGRDRASGWGAVELTARFSYFDLFDADAPPGPSGQLVGLRISQSTFGVNWYLADRMRLMFNYNYTLPVEPNTGTSAANIFSARLGVFW